MDRIHEGRVEPFEQVREWVNYLTELERQLKLLDPKSMDVVQLEQDVMDEVHLTVEQMKSKIYRVFKDTMETRH